MQVTLKIFRYNPEDGRKKHYDTFTLEAEPTDRVLDLLERIRSLHGARMDGIKGSRLSRRVGVATTTRRNICVKRCGCRTARPTAVSPPTVDTWSGTCTGSSFCPRTGSSTRRASRSSTTDITAICARTAGAGSPPIESTTSSPRRSSPPGDGSTTCPMGSCGARTRAGASAWSISS